MAFGRRPSSAPPRARCRGSGAARGGATSAAAQDWLGPKADAARLMAADDGEDFREALITPVFQELAYVGAQRLNPWFQPWMYTKATDFMLDVVDGLEEGFAALVRGARLPRHRNPPPLPGARTRSTRRSSR